MRVLHVCAELFPLLKTGGLADVAGALPLAQRRLGADARVLLPGFPAILAGLADAADIARIPLPWQTRWGEPAEARLLLGHLPLADGSGLPLYAIDAPHLYERPGNPYADEHQHPYGDNHRRFALLGWTGALLAQGLDPQWRAECVHGHDWHAGLTSAYLAQARMHRHQRIAGSVFTVHNLAYQGLFDARHLPELGLPPRFFDVDGLEFYGQISFLKAGLHYSDRITTVSPTYAREIQTPEQGEGLDGLLRQRAGELDGILNGIDTEAWNPATDPTLAGAFDASHPEAKATDKAALQQAFGLAPQADAPLFVVVSRLTGQKGLDLVLGQLDAIVSRGGQLALLGSGDAGLEAGFRTAAQARPEAVGVRLGYDEALAHRMFAGGDVVLVPSRFEPCGLTQLYGMHYGCLPLVRRVGGLADTVVDSTLEELADGRATGFVFERFDGEDYGNAVRRAFALYRRKEAWRQVQRHAMTLDFGWESPARAYLALYRPLVEAAR